MVNRSLQTHKIEKLMSFSSSSFATSHAHDLNSQEFSILRIIESCKSIRELKQIHSYIIKTGRPQLQTQPVYTKTISMCALSPDIDLSYVHSVFAQLSNPNISNYNAIIRCLSGCKNNNESITALLLYRELLTRGLVPDNYTFPFLLKACAQLQALSEGKEVHAHAIKNGLSLDLYVMNTLMRMYAVCGVIGAVQKLFDESPNRDLVSWTTLIQGYVKMGYWKEGIRVFFEMCEAKFRADEMTMVIVLSACAKLGDLSLGRKIHKYMHDNKVTLDIYIGNALVDMYLKCGDACFARKVFNEMPVKNVVSWNSMISGLAQQGEFKEALDVFRKMQSRGVKPDDVTLVAVLNACANLGVIELGKWVHKYVDKHMIKADGFIGNALVDMYAKCGSIAEAFRVFDGMKCRDVYTYTAMIVGLAMHGQGERALDLFFEMPKMGIKPDEVTFVGVLTACSHVGLVEEGRKHFEDMVRVYNLVPQTEHYGCMVDLLGRAGLISEAEEFIENMPIEPDAFGWGALLGACRIHGKIELAERVMEKLLEIEPERDGAYILMTNIYSSANRWRDALKLRKAMKGRNMKKTPGCSSIEVDGVVHEFRKGDKAHPKAKEIYMLLDEMTSQLKSSGLWTHSDAFSNFCRKLQAVDKKSNIWGGRNDGEKNNGVSANHAAPADSTFIQSLQRPTDTGDKQNNSICIPKMYEETTSACYDTTTMQEGVAENGFSQPVPNCGSIFSMEELSNYHQNPSQEDAAAAAVDGVAATTAMEMELQQQLGMDMEHCYNSNNNSHSDTHLMQAVGHDSNQVLSYDHHQSNWETSVHDMQDMNFSHNHPHQEQHLQHVIMQNGHHQGFNSSSLPDTPYPPTADLLNLFHLPRCTPSSLLPNSSISFANPTQKSTNFSSSLGFLGDLPNVDSNAPVTNVLYDPLFHLNLPPQPPLFRELYNSLPHGYNLTASTAGSLFGGVDEREGSGVYQDGDGRNFDNGVLEFTRDINGMPKGRDGKNPEHFATERHRRQHLNEKYQALRSFVPNPTKTDRASIVGDAIEYIKELLRTVNELKILVDKKRCSRERSKRHKTEDDTAGDVESSNMKPLGDHQDQSYNGTSALRSSWLQRKSKDTEIDVRIIDDEVTIKLVQRKKINCLLFVSKALDELQLDLHHVAWWPHWRFLQLFVQHQDI
ncbi:hypothetical protein F0562_014601 [Nyssa sinensis]|uniref:BHLH domain-containing protein n=1 Tax=Nyssa sinensis TaxID=561372 RepID=A0A5J4ZNW1_9ASTE|nr:hypothetical protein F0562_014601 [Nyssa sinensis]